MGRGVLIISSWRSAGSSSISFFLSQFPLLFVRIPTVLESVWLLPRNLLFFYTDRATPPVIPDGDIFTISNGPSNALM
ncbi:hypothetical protein LguiA_026720 [Lonicera macranthoides]